MLGTQSIRSSLGLGRHLASSLHSDHVLIPLAHFQDLTPSCQGEVAPMTDFPSDPAGVGLLIAGCHSCDWLQPHSGACLVLFLKTTAVILLGCWPLVFSDCGGEELTHTSLSVDVFKAPGVVWPKGYFMTRLALGIVGYWLPSELPSRVKVVHR